MNTINYSNIARAVELYRRLGFNQIEVPWRISENIVNLTKPITAKPGYKIEGTDKALLASGEQGFMYLMNKGFLAPGRYQTVTPCFRNEQYDETHSKQFLKVELIHVLESDVNVSYMGPYLQNMHREAKVVLSGISGKDVNLVMTNLSEYDETNVNGMATYDLQIDGIEIGSYGVREAIFGKWIYGTGIAEPRFSKIAGL